MKTNWISCLLVGMWLAGCSPENLVPAPVVTTTPKLAPNEDVSALYRQFHGKYKVITSVSSEALDVDLDGKVSTNMALEIPELATAQGRQYSIELRIYGPSQYSPKPSFSFNQWWPEQFIRTGPGRVWDGGELLAYNPNYVVKYDFQGSGRSFSFSTDLKQITVNPNSTENLFRWVRPESVTVEDNGRLRVVNKRRLYTSAGVKEVVITTVYERYTMIT